tara:strand:+ start:454 stop:906 length:453 start_codon:yes stop_codon:yes gene_type:complete
MSDIKLEGVNICKQIFASDDRLNYTFIKKEELLDEERGASVPEWLDKDKIDYDIIVKKEEDNDEYTTGLGKLDQTLPASFVAVKTVEDGINWLSNKHPEYPDEFCEILARYHWGKQDNEPPKEVKKKKRRNKKHANKLKIRQGNFKVDFN